MKIRKEILDQIVAHAVADLPNECCGLLLGTAETADHFAAIRRARAAGLQIVGAYHSHPNGPSGPSEMDRARLTDPTMFHLIVSLAHGTRTVRAFRLTEGNFSPLELVPVP